LYTFKRLSNSSREDGSNDNPVQIQKQKKSATVDISNSFLYRPCTNSKCRINSICSMATWVPI